MLSKTYANTSGDILRTLILQLIGFAVAGTAAGVFFSRNEGTLWSEVNSGLISR